MRRARISTATGSIGLLLHGAGHAGHVVLDEKRIHHRDGKRAEQRARHERAPVVDVALDELGHDADRDGLHFRRRDEREGVDELVPRQREGEDARRDEPGHRERQDDLHEDLPARGAVDQRALLQLERDRAEVAHQEPRAERDQERGVREDEGPARVEETELEDDGRERDEEDRRRHEVGEEDREPDLLRAAESQPLDGVGGEDARGDRREGGDHRDHHRVPHPLGIWGVEEQLLEVRERGLGDPERVALARQELGVRLERRRPHPVEREEQHEEEHEER